MRRDLLVSVRKPEISGAEVEDETKSYLLIKIVAEQPRDRLCGV